MLFLIGGDGDIDETSGVETLLNILISLAYLAYFVVMEGTSGATLGKRILKIRVVKVDGSALTMRESLIRNILRIIDGIFVYLVGAILIWTSPNKQRLGDRLAGTIVVSDAARTQVPEPPYPTAPEQRF